MADVLVRGYARQRPLSLSDPLSSYESIIADFGKIKAKLRKMDYRRLSHDDNLLSAIASPSTDLYNIDLDILRLGTLTRVAVILSGHMLAFSASEIQAWNDWGEECGPRLCQMRRALRELLRCLVR